MHERRIGEVAEALAEIHDCSRFYLLRRVRAFSDTGYPPENATKSMVPWFQCLVPRWSFRGAAKAASPEPITPVCDDGFRAPSLRSGPGMTAEGRDHSSELQH